MNDSLWIGFKGRNNASCALAQAVSPHHFLLTNSYSGLKKDIDGMIDDPDAVYFFGVDKNLKDSFRIEKEAEKDGIRMATRLDTEALRKNLEASGIRVELSQKPTKYLCNEAYWWLLRKFGGKVVLIHIPTTKSFDESRLAQIRQALTG